MLSLFIFLLLFGIQLLLVTAIPTWLARRGGGTQVTWRRGLLIAAGLVIVNVGLNIVLLFVPATSVAAGLGGALGSFVIMLLIAAGLFRIGFGLPGRATVLVTGVYAVTSILLGVVMVAAVRPYVLETFTISTGCMEPTLQIKDCCIANKLLRPQRFDLIVYRNRDPDRSPWAKRLIGLPGETLRFEANGLRINGQPITLPATLADLRATPRNAPPRYAEGEDIRLGPDEYFFVGDNGDRSVDSRLQGPSPLGDLIGVIDVVYWPLSRFAVIR